MPWTITYTIADAKGAKSSTSLNLPDATALDAVEAMADAMASRINDIITGAITGINISRALPLTAGLRVTPTTNSDVEEGARFQFQTVNRFYTAMRLPTFSEAKIATNSKLVTLTDVEVDAFVDAMIGGVDLPGTLPLVEPCDARGEDITSLTFAREQFLSSGR